MQVIGGGIHNWTDISDTVNKLKHPLRWLYRVCRQTDRFQLTLTIEVCFEASWDLFNASTGIRRGLF